MHPYGMRDIARILRLPQGRVRAMIAHGFVRPERGPRRAWRFSFQDLVVLRTARSLELARVPTRRIHRSLARLRSQLPDGLPLAGLTVRAVGDRVVVHEGEAAWLADSGQYVLEISVQQAPGGVCVVERAVPPTEQAQQWFERAVTLEAPDPPAACAAYRQVLALDPCEPAAYVNLGRLLHDAGDVEGAARVYRDGLARCEPSALLLFNLALVLEDAGDAPAAIDAYRRALERDPAHADAHFNLARLHEAAGDFRRAVRHLAEYRRLTVR
jgi:tetratricopeptide (TPR) repeat protein